MLTVSEIVLPYSRIMSIFTDKVIVITGGASGIGLALAKQLSLLGGKIIIVDRNNLDELQVKDHQLQFELVDMTDQRAVEMVFEKILESYEKIDYVINNAGIFMGGEIRDTKLENWHKVVSNNIFAIMNGSHFAYRAMLKQGHGHIINMGSAAGLMPIPAMGIYGSTKYAIVGFTHALRNEAKDFGIKVSVICPTIVDTPLYDTAIYNNVNDKEALKSRGSFQSVDEAAKRIIDGIRKNKATIHTAASTRIIWWIYRLAPSIYDIVARKIHRKYRTQLRK